MAIGSKGTINTLKRIRKLMPKAGSGSINLRAAGTAMRQQEEAWASTGEPGVSQKVSIFIVCHNTQVSCHLHNRTTTGSVQMTELPQRHLGCPPQHDGGHQGPEARLSKHQRAPPTQWGTKRDHRSSAAASRGPWRHKRPDSDI